jgi:hypothetical protein
MGRLTMVGHAKALKIEKCLTPPLGTKFPLHSCSPLLIAKQNQMLNAILLRKSPDKLSWMVHLSLVNCEPWSVLKMNQFSNARGAGGSAASRIHLSALRLLQGVRQPRYRASNQHRD